MLWAVIPKSMGSMKRRKWRSYIDTPPPADADCPDARKPCTECGALSFMEPFCFDCKRAKYGSPYSFYASMSTAGEDSTNPSRVRDGTNIWNLGLPGVDIDQGKRKNGKRALDYRPISNNELPTNRARRDYAARHGCGVIEDAPKRAIGGR